MISRIIVVAAVAAAGSMAAISSAVAGEPIAVCIGDDGTMRKVEPETTCPDGQEKRLLAEWDAEAPDGEETTAALEAKIAQLTGRLAALEAHTAPTDTSGEAVTRLSAPFEVVGSDGTVILRVATDAATPKGARVTIGGGSANNYALRVYKPGGQLVAGIGQSTQGGGLAVVMDNSGKPAAEMDGQDPRVVVFKDAQLVAGIAVQQQGGIVAVYSPSGQPIAFLTTSSAGDGGNVTTALNNGFGVFSAGAAQDGGGEACVSRITQAGTPRLACVGLGLPSAGMGK
jgi:hypothetical protein